MDRFLVNATIDAEFAAALERLEVALEDVMLELRAVDEKLWRRVNGAQAELLRLTDRMQDRAVDIALFARMRGSDNEQEQEQD